MSPERARAVVAELGGRLGGIVRRGWALARRCPEAVIAAGLLAGVAAMVVHWR